MQAGDADRVKMDDRDWRVTCPECGRTFEAQRSDATYCSNRCRTHASRAPQRRANALHRLEFMAIDLREIKNSYRHSQDVLDKMLILRKVLDSCINDFDVEWKPQELELSPAPARRAAAKKAATRSS